MRYSLEPSYRKYVQGQGFMSFAKNMSNKYCKKLLDKSIDVSNKYGRKLLDKSAEAAGEMIGNKTADKITKKPRNKMQKEDERNSRNNYSSRKNTTNN